MGKAEQGPGKYDAECVEALMKTGATVCLLAVIGGKRGNGFSLNSRVPGAEKVLPKLLREMADMIEGVS